MPVVYKFRTRKQMKRRKTARDLGILLCAVLIILGLILFARLVVACGTAL